MILLHLGYLNLPLRLDKIIVKTKTVIGKNKLNSYKQFRLLQNNAPITSYCKET